MTSSHACISDVQAWMHHNKLQLNIDKMEMILISPKHIQKPKLYIQLNGCDIIIFVSVLDLGALLTKFSFQEHVSVHIRPAFLSSVESVLSVTISLTTLIWAFIRFHIDYCNSLLTGCPPNLICKFQNNAAHLVSCFARSDHKSPIVRGYLAKLRMSVMATSQMSSPHSQVQKNKMWIC